MTTTTQPQKALASQQYIEALNDAQTCIINISKNIRLRIHSYVQQLFQRVTFEHYFSAPNAVIRTLMRS